MVLNIFILCDANFKCLTHLNPHMFNLYVGSSKLYNLYSVAGTCICISFLAEQWRVCTKLTAFISHLDTRSSYQHPLSSVYWWISERTRTVGGPVSFSVIIFSIDGWLTQGIHAEDMMDSFLIHVSWKVVACLLCLEQVVVSTKAWPPQALSAFTFQSWM